MAPKSQTLILLTTVVMVVAGLLSYSLLPADAQAPERSPQWEYKVVDFYPNKTAESTQALNVLASQGWEYVGLIHPPYDGNKREAAKSAIAFRRAKS